MSRQHAGRRRAHLLRVDRRHRPDSVAVLPDQAARLVEFVDTEPAGRVAESAAPPRTHAELARMYLAARGGRRPVVQVPLPGRIVAGYRAGANLVPDNAVGTIGFGFVEYLAETK
jgi:hypothetical protein